MGISSAQLLKQLEPAVRPSVAPAARTNPHAAVEAQTFEQLLSLAGTGAVHSGRQIEVAFDPSPPLEPSQLERLAIAADQAQAGGAKQALMLIDGRGFVLDVESRTLTAELSSDSQSKTANIDAAFFVGGENENGQAPTSALQPPRNGLISTVFLPHKRQQH